MKKRNLIFILFAVFFALLIVNGVNALTCNLNAKLINQDPYPAVPGDYVKLAFQVTGAENPDCGTINFQIAPEFPFSLDPGQNDSIQVQSGTFTPDYSSSLTIPFRIRVDKTAIAGTNTIKLRYAQNVQTGQPNYIVGSFDVQVANTKSDFEVLVQDITPQGTSFIVTNTGENDAKSVILTVQSADVSVSGPTSVVIGNLNKGDFTIAHIGIIPNSAANDLNVKISYTDNAGKRVDVEKIVPISSSSRIEKICWNNSENWYVKWIFGVVGIFLGMEALVLLRTLSRKKKRN